MREGEPTIEQGGDDTLLTPRERATAKKLLLTPREKQAFILAGEVKELSKRGDLDATLRRNLETVTRELEEDKKHIAGFDSKFAKWEETKAGITKEEIKDLLGE